MGLDDEHKAKCTVTDKYTEAERVGIGIGVGFAVIVLVLVVIKLIVSRGMGLGSLWKSFVKKTNPS